MSKCYTCVHRRDVPGDCHSACGHPKVMGLGVVLLVLPAAVRPFVVEGDPHGIAKGWFMWPINFDPVWLRRCDGYEQLKSGKEDVDETTAQPS